MAAVGTVRVQCPECGVDVPVTTQAWSTTGDHNVIQIVLEPDYTDVWAHTWTHEP